MLRTFTISGPAVMTNAQGNSELFKAAHQMTKAIIKAGDYTSVEA